MPFLRRLKRFPAPFLAVFRLVSIAAALVLLSPLPAHPQLPPMPPDVQAIMNKLSAGQPITQQEQQRMMTWTQQATAGANPSPAPKPDSTSKPRVNAPSKPLVSAPPAAPAGAKISFAQLCPKPASAALPATAPTAPQYLALVQSLAGAYARKLDPDTRIGIEGGVTRAGLKAASLPAALVAAGAPNDAVYAGALAAQRNVLDVNAANNLGVSLEQAGDYRNSALVLLYLGALRPQSPLASVNLAWTYFNAGAAADAKAQFLRAQKLAPDMAAPEEGQGLIAGCQGDMLRAKNLLGTALKKGYSTAGAVGLMAAQQAQSSSSSATDAGWQPPDSDPPPNPDSVIPELNLPADIVYSPNYADTLTALMHRSQSRLTSLGAQMLSASQRVAAIQQRSRQQGDTAISLPLTFESELFEWKEVTDLAFRARFRNVDQANQQFDKVMTSNADTVMGQMETDYKHLNDIQNEEIDVEKDSLRCPDDPCRDAHQQHVQNLIYQLQQLQYRMCLQEKASDDVVYTQAYKVWKTQWDDFHAAVPDLYAFTNPILKRVWVPALYDFLSLQRESMVYSIYAPLAGGAAALAKTGDTVKNLKCTPPTPPKQEEAKDPNLPKPKGPDCPLGDGAGLGLGVVKITLGCDSASIEGGELYRFKASRTFSTHSTTLWAGVGAGVEAGLEGDFLSKVSPKAELTAEVGAGVTIGKGGTVSDVFVTSTLAAEAGVGKSTLGMSASGTLSLENGASLSGDIAGIIGGTLHE